MPSHESPTQSVLRLASSDGSRYSHSNSGGPCRLAEGQRKFQANQGGKLMAGSVNKVILIGNLGRDPEVRTMQNGGKVCNLAVATSEQWRDKNSGERRERTEWHRVVIFNEHFLDVAEKYLRKGSKVYIEGQLRTRKWQDRNGQDRYTTEIVLSGPGAVLKLLDGAPKQGDAAHADNGGTAGSGFDAELDDEVPF